MLDLTDYDAVDLCAGPGGWDVAAERLGLNVLGFEIDEAAILTRDAVGHHTATVECEPSKEHPRGVRGLSMTEVDPRDYFVRDPGQPYAHGRGRGQIASPPCQGFSTAGKGQARADSERLLKELAEVRTLADVEELIESCQHWMSHPGTALVLEPLRWALATNPSWLAWEQVPAVLPIWEACAVILRRLGYSVETGNLQAEQYGVPQTRKRAVLVARAPWLVAVLGPVALPTPTHSRYYSRTPDKLDPGVLPWVSMAEALAAPDPFVHVSNYGTGGDPAARGERPSDAPAATVTSKADRTKVRFGDVKSKNGAVRDLDKPSPTLTASADNGSTSCAIADPRPVTEPAQTLTGKGTAEWGTRPTRAAGPKDRDPDGVRVSPEQAATLQSFPRGYSFQGTKGKVFQQIGNAIPPLLAEAILCAVLDLPFEHRLRVAA